jgi:hypothetical protein
MNLRDKTHLIKLEGSEVQSSDIFRVVNSYGGALMISNCTVNGKQVQPVKRQLHIQYVELYGSMLTLQQAKIFATNITVNCNDHVSYFFMSDAICSI